MEAKKIPPIRVSQPLTGIDMFHVLPNVLVGSYPTKKSLLGESENNNFTKILDFLSTEYDRALIINLSAEKGPYHIDRKYENMIFSNWICWIDYHAIALGDFITLIYGILTFLQTPSSGVFIHCKHGKGRTGTLVCALLLQMYQLSVEEANELFIQRRKIYQFGVQCKPQLSLLNYWDYILKNSTVKKTFLKLTKIRRHWFLKKIKIEQNNQDNLKEIEIKVANIYEQNKNPKLIFKTIGKLRPNYDCYYNEEMEPNVCFELGYGSYITKSLVTFSFNIPMEMAIRNTPTDSELVLKFNWDSMDGVKGTEFKGKKYFDEIVIWIS